MTCDCAPGHEKHWDSYDYRWTLWQKAICGAANVAMAAMHHVMTFLWWASGSRIHMLDARRRWLWDFYLWLACYAYPWGIWRTGV